MGGVGGGLDLPRAGENVAAAINLRSSLWICGCDSGRDESCSHTNVNAFDRATRGRKRSD